MDFHTYRDILTQVKSKCGEKDRRDIFSKKQEYNIKTYWSEAEDPSIEGCAEYLLELFPEKIKSKVEINYSKYDPYDF